MRNKSRVAAPVARLRFVLSLFFVALALPSTVVIYQAFSRLKWGAFHQHQLQAEELVARIDGRLRELIASEEARPFVDYAFLTVAGNPTANFVQRSPLATWPMRSDVPGLIGYFQVDANNHFSTPLLPENAEDPTLGIPTDELEQRRAIAARLRDILSRNRLVRELPTAPQVNTPSRPTLQGNALKTVPSSVTSATGQTAFDSLNEMPAEAFAIAKRDDIRSATSGIGLSAQSSAAAPTTSRDQAKLEMKAVDAVERRQARKERGAVVEQELTVEKDQALDGKLGVDKKSDLRVRIFESEIDPLEFSALDSGHFVLYRKVWRGGSRFVQGLLFAQKPFLDGLISAPYRDTNLAGVAQLAVLYQGRQIDGYAGNVAEYLTSREVLRGTLLQQAKLSPPLGALELVFNITNLPVGAGGAALGWSTAVLAAVLCGGLWSMYRLGIRQIQLARQQQDFVSAVSHELKTPLTSIRMYSEMLREGWVSEPKKAEYYTFIHDESTRLSRLINNVLNLARMTRDELNVELKPTTVRELIDLVRSKVSSSVTQAGGELRLQCAEEIGSAIVDVDHDCFTQIILNLVDNALKFSARATNRDVEITCAADGKDHVVISVRDFGPGIPPAQHTRIFELFYRAENELKRETTGTGIGLALVKQLADAMSATVSVVNAAPGAEFQLRLLRRG